MIGKTLLSAGVIEVEYEWVPAYELINSDADWICVHLCRIKLYLSVSKAGRPLCTIVLWTMEDVEGFPYSSHVTALLCDWWFLLALG